MRSNLQRLINASISVLLIIATPTLDSCRRLEGIGGRAVPEPVIEHYLAIRYVDPPLEGPTTTVLSMADADDANRRMRPTDRLHLAQPVTDADRANGIAERYLVTISGVLRRHATAEQEDREVVVTKLASGVWLTDLAAFNPDGTLALLKNVAGDYETATAGPFSGRGVRCAMTINSTPRYAGTVACHGARTLEGRVRAFAWFEIPPALHAESPAADIGLLLLTTSTGTARRCAVMGTGPASPFNVDCRAAGAADFPIELMTFRRM